MQTTEERLAEVRARLKAFVDSGDKWPITAYSFYRLDVPWLLELVNNLQNAVQIYQPQILELRKLEERMQELEAERGD